MATIRNGRISTTFPYNKVHGIPELDLDDLDCDHSAGAPVSIASASPASTTARAERRNISRAEPCFITNQTAYSHKKAHLVNAVRNDKRMKFSVEFFLKNLGVVGIKFNLNSASNLAPMDRTLHYVLDKLGFFVTTCSKTTLQAMINVVDQENAIFQQRVNEGEAYMRRFPRRQPPFSNAEYELVVLQPHHFLQKGGGLAVYTKQGDMVDGKLYVVSEDGALRENTKNDSARLPAFTSHPGRAPEHMLNPLLVIINAEMAFRRFQRNPHPLCDDYQELIQLTITLVDKIYFKPVVDELLPTLEKLTSRAGVQDVEMAGPANEFRGQPEGEKDKTLTRRGGVGRTGGVVEKPGPGASHDEVIEYQQYLMSGCDHDNSDSDEDEWDDELDNQELNDKNPLVPSLQTVSVIEKVEQWQLAAHYS